MVMVKSWLNDKLTSIEDNCKEALLKQQLEMRSRLGPEMVIFDIDFSSTVRIANDRLSVRSQGSFNTIKANVCVYGGKWMYEVIFLFIRMYSSAFLLATSQIFRQTLTLYEQNQKYQ